MRRLIFCSRLDAYLYLKLGINLYKSFQIITGLQRYLGIQNIFAKY